GAVYKGLAIASDGAGNHLYASDFHTGDVQMFTNGFSAAPTTFTDPNVAAGYAPFNVQTLNGELYVTFALQDAARHDDVAGAGHGYVDVFNLDGTFNRRLVSLGGEINSPWGLAIAPSTFGDFAGDLLVGNFGDGTISAFNDTTGTFEGRLLGRDGNPLQFGDLWALTPGNGVTGSQQDIYFTAGLSDEAHGLFGRLSVAPEPETWWLAILGFGLTGTALRGQANWRRGFRAAPNP
ncbi:MAG TPA: TIGR03118 family protein, partial [Phenylobacterium sp.]|nr:TIGR03118 family protein [Phenylobacterium sp.]